MSHFFNDLYFSSGQYMVDDENHEWIGCGGEYYVCREGLVCKGNKLLKLHKGDIQGHLNVRMSIDGKIYEKYVHRLVAEKFIPNPKHFPIVRHLDDDKENNSVDNLAWGTQKDNIADMRKNGNAYVFSLEDREKHLSKQRRPVVAISQSGEKIVFPSQTFAAKALKLQQSNIGKVLCGERNQTGGYRFKYTERRQNEYY